MTNTRAAVAVTLVAALALLAVGASAGAGGSGNRLLARAAPFAPTRDSRLASSAGCVRRWLTVASPRIREGILRGVAAGSPDRAWAVGYVGLTPREENTEESSGSSDTKPLIERWDGRKWTAVEGPDVRGGLEAVAIAAADDAWAVGGRGWAGEGGWKGSGYRAPLIAHWDGRSWTTMPIRGTMPLWDVSVSSGSDVWAVGSKWDDTGRAGVVLHWDGRRWAQVAAPALLLRDVLAISPRDVWAVGENTAMHWNGRRWRTYRMPPVRVSASGSVRLLSVAAASRNDVWAVGEAGHEQLHRNISVLMHWNGRRWTNRSPSPRTHLYGSISAWDVAARPRGDVWVAGTDATAFAPNGLSGSAVMRLTGSRWQTTELRTGELLEALAVDKDTNLWAVGWTGTDPDYGPYGDGWPLHTTPLVKRFAC